MRIGLLILAAMSLSGCGFVLAKHLIKESGSGVMKTTTHQVATFDRISTSIPGDIEVVVGGALSVKSETDDNLVDNLKIEVKDGELRLRSKGHTNPTKMAFTISVPSLNAFELSGAGDVNLSKLNAKSFKLDISGAAEIKMSGHVTDLFVDSSGASDVDAKALKAQTATVDISGAGSVWVNAIKSLNADISGAASVTYSGDPAITKSISGVGSVQKG
jgi:Putative auto-transporter adhesin, head GIN domain